MTVKSIVKPIAKRATIKATAKPVAKPVAKPKATVAPVTVGWRSMTPAQLAKLTKKPADMASSTWGRMHGYVPPAERAAKAARATGGSAPRARSIAMAPTAAQLAAAKVKASRGARTPVKAASAVKAPRATIAPKAVKPTVKAVKPAPQRDESIANGTVQVAAYRQTCPRCNQAIEPQTAITKLGGKWTHYTCPVVMPLARTMAAVETFKAVLRLTPAELVAQFGDTLLDATDAQMACADLADKVAQRLTDALALSRKGSTRARRANRAA